MTTKRHKFQSYLSDDRRAKLLIIKKKQRYSQAQIIEIALDYLFTGEETEDVKNAKKALRDKS